MVMTCPPAFHPVVVATTAAVAAAAVVVVVVVVVVIATRVIEARVMHKSVPSLMYRVCG